MKGHVLKFDALAGLLSLFDEEADEFDWLYDFGLLEGVDKVKAIRLFSSLETTKPFSVYADFPDNPDDVIGDYVDGLLLEPLYII